MRPEIPTVFQEFTSTNPTCLQFVDDCAEEELLDQAEEDEEFRPFGQTIIKIVHALSLPSRLELAAAGATRWKIIAEVFADERSGYFDKDDYSECHEPITIRELNSLSELRTVVAIALAEPLIHALRAHIQADVNSNHYGFRVRNLGRSPKVYIGGKIVTATEKMDPSTQLGAPRRFAIYQAQRAGRPLVYDRLGRPRVFEENALLIPLTHPLFYSHPSVLIENPEERDINT